MQLITLGQDSSVADGSCCSSQLVQDICKRLLIPSVPLSAAAARKLRLQCPRASAAVPSEGLLLRSLPVELLYDDAGLDLFDQITQLPEYYLTAAESDILAASGHDIVQACVARNEALLVELGAGSMRKTRLLLDAVLDAGRQDATFCALDLCQQSLRDALQALQGVYKGSIELVGLVGTYQEGLAYLQQQQQQQQQQQHSQNKTSSESICPAKQEGHIHHAAVAGPHEDISPSNSCASTCICISSNGPLTQQLPAMHNLMLSASCDDEPRSASPDSSTTSSSSNLPDAPAAAAHMHHSSESSSSINGSDWCVDVSANAPAAAPAGEELYTPSEAFPSTEGPPCAGKQPSAVHCDAAAAGKVILWLGSSIGNCTRPEAAAFLRQLKQAAMQPGDVLLVGIDRRNSPAKVEAAYNDAAGVTRAFILNGLAHCKRLLDVQLAACHTYSSSSSSSLDPADFSYFCLYNEELGRHEAYYQAVKDTTITLPASAAAAAAAALSGNPDGNAAGGNGDALGVAGSSTDLNPVVVPVAAGELVHVEYSHKYSRQEVVELAAAAGLVWVKAWSDSQQQYDLHMFRG